MRKGVSAGEQFTIAIPKLHTGQIKVLEMMKRYTFISAGRGWRKSSLSAYVAMQCLMNKIDVLWCAETKQSIVPVREDMWRRIFGEDLWSRCYNRTDDMIIVPSWGQLFFRSLDSPDNTRGFSNGKVICDEMGVLTKGTYASVLSKIVLKSRGSFLGVGTFDPIDPDDCDLAVQIDNAKDFPDIQIGLEIPALGATVVGDDLVRVPHELENPDYTWDEILTDWRTTPRRDRGRWQVEVLCKRIKTGLERQIVDPKAACCLDYEQISEDTWGLKGYKPSRNRMYNGGVDLGRELDKCVISICDRELLKQVYLRILSIDRSKPQWKQIYRAIAWAVHNYPGEYNLDKTGMGDAAPETLLEDYNCKVEGFNFSGAGSAKKVALCDHMTDILDGNVVKLLNVDEQVRQLTNFGRKVVENKIKISGIGSNHDDVPIAIALMVKPIKKNEIGYESLFDNNDSEPGFYKNAFSTGEPSKFSSTVLVDW